jgi:hypothetical protein
VSVFTLWAALDVVQRREASRAGRAPLGDRVAACHAAMEPNLAGLGEIVLADRPAAEIAALLDRRSRAG